MKRHEPPELSPADSVAPAFSDAEGWRDFKLADAAGPLAYGPFITALFWTASNQQRLIAMAVAHFIGTAAFVILIWHKGRTEPERCDPLHEAWAGFASLGVALVPWAIGPDRSAFFALAFLFTIAVASDTLYMSMRHSRWWGWFLAISALSYTVFFFTQRSLILAGVVGLFGAHMWDGTRSIKHVLGSLRTARDHNEHLAQTDYLTGLANRRGIFHTAESWDDTAVLHWAVIDIDNFKHINDQYGYAEGDRTLIGIGQKIQQLLGHEWAVARTGGDEFMAVSPNGSLPRLEHMRRGLMQPSEASALMPISTSIGVAYGRRDEEVWNDALAAVRVSKRRGKGQIVAVGQALQERIRQERALVTRLPTAIANGEIVLWAQPIFDTSRGQVFGYECLARWERADGTMISPAEFIPLIEEQGLSIQLGELVLTEAAKFAGRVPDGVSVTVNISASHFEHESFVNLLDRVIAETGARPSSLIIEITETEHGQDPVRQLVTARAVRERGFGLAVDDVGSGYSSMERLIELPFSHLKIDMVLVQSCTHPATRHLVAGLVHFANNASVAVIAEGVETEAQAGVLQELGITLVQGFLFARPAPLDLLVNRAQPVMPTLSGPSPTIIGPMVHETTVPFDRPTLEEPPPAVAATSGLSPR